MLYEPLNVFEGNTHKYILTDVDVASKYKVTRSLRAKRASEVVFALEAIYEKGGMFSLNTPSYFNVIMGLSLKEVWQSCLKNTMIAF